MTKEEIEKEAEDIYSPLLNKCPAMWTSNELVRKCIESYIAGRTKSDARVKELEEGLKWCFDYFSNDFLPDDHKRIKQLLNNKH